MTYFKQQREEIEKGCGEEIARIILLGDIDGDETEIIICNNENLCSDCLKILQQLNKDEDAVRKVIKKWRIEMNKDLESGRFEGQFDCEVDILLNELGLNSKETKDG